MMMETSKYGFKHILTEDNHILTMRDERILTGCKANRSSFRGLVRLVPKTMNPELMPAEWRALSKLKHKENTSIYVYISLKIKQLIEITTQSISCCAVRLDDKYL